MAKRKIIKLINGASSLMLLNGKDSKQMAKASSSRKAPAARKHSGRKTNPTQRRTRKASRRHFGRRSNPSVTVLVSEAITAGIGAMATDYAASFLPFTLGPLSRILAKGAIAFGLGRAIRFASPSHGRVADLVTLGGAANAATDLVRWGFPSIQRVFIPGASQPVAVAASAQPAAAHSAQGVQDIVTLEAGDYDSYYGQMPAFQGMNDIVTVGDNYFN